MYKIHSFPDFSQTLPTLFQNKSSYIPLISKIEIYPHLKKNSDSKVRKFWKRCESKFNNLYYLNFAQCFSLNEIYFISYQKILKRYESYMLKKFNDLYSLSFAQWFFLSEIYFTSSQKTLEPLRALYIELFYWFIFFTFYPMVFLKRNLV